MISLDTLKTLEYYKITEMLKDRTGSSYGKELADQLMPSVKPAEVTELITETQEASSIIYAADKVPLGGIREIRSLIKRAEIGGVLEPHEILAVGSTLYAARKLKSFIQVWQEKAPGLNTFIQQIINFPKLEKAIENTISEHGAVLDEASSELARIRREIRSGQQRIKEKLDHILRSPEYHKFFQEVLVTIRGDRYVIPVKQEYRNSFPGIVHDQSASGATVFIEPMSVVNLNNELKQAIAAEINEIERILRAISAQIAAVAAEIRLSCDITAKIDLIFAKAYLARDLKANCPVLNTAGFVDIRQARHPLISAEVIVPIDINIGKKFNTLIITGPNTGGKTVSLKTLGLFVLMTQSGLFIPAAPGSEISVFKQVFADIGDEQSIEQSLSTFSAHMTSLVGTLKNARPGDLVLIDEIGAGTDPDEGAALAMAILDYLTNKQVKTIATTHYSELKAFAYSRGEVENASVEFDIATLRPTYKLLIGTPGSSNALLISRRLGLNKDIVEQAKKYLNKEHQEFEQLVSELEMQKQAYYQKIAKTEELQNEIVTLRNELQVEQAALEEKRRKILADTYEEATQVIRRGRREIEAVIEELKTQYNVKDSSARQKAINSARQRIRREAESLQADGILNYETELSVEQVKQGDLVFVAGVNQQGTVLAIRNTELTVQLGIMRLNVPVKQCHIVKNNKLKDQTADFSPGRSHSLKNDSVPLQIDIRGTTIDEAENILEKYLDNAVLAGLNEVLVIHGKGTGALRKGIRDYFYKQQQVKSISIAQINEGGNGATTVKLR